MKARILVAVLLVCALARGATNNVLNTFEIYPLGSSDGAALETIVRTMVGADGTVTFDSAHNRLLVLAQPDQHKQIAAIMSKSAVSPKNVSIEVNFLGGESSKTRGASVNGGVVVERSGGSTGVRYKVQPQVIDNSIQTTENTKQMLMVASGREARLRVGETVPYESWLVNYGLTYGYIQKQIAWRDVGSYLVVEPTVIGDGPMVRIRVTPELSGTVNGSAQATRFAAVSTEVTVNDGETVTIGGAAKDSEFYERFLIGGFRSGGSRRMNITLTPHIMDLGARPAGAPPAGSQIPQTIRVWGEERAIPQNRP
jgi:type II secretory pathway component HofQ